MDAHIIEQIQREGAEALLNAGVSLPLKDFKVPLLKRRLHLRLTMERPTLGRLIELSREWLSVGMTLDEFEGLDWDGQMAFLGKHGKTLSRMIALTIRCRWVPTGVLSWLVRHWMPWEYQKAAVVRFLTLVGTSPFTIIIRSAARMNPMRVRLSQGKKGS